MMFHQNDFILSSADTFLSSSPPLSPPMGRAGGEVFYTPGAAPPGGGDHAVLTPDTPCPPFSPNSQHMYEPDQFFCQLHSPVGVDSVTSPEGGVLIGQREFYAGDAMKVVLNVNAIAFLYVNAMYLLSVLRY